MKRLVWAPIDLSQPHLRILDSGAANGKWIQDLRKAVPEDVRESDTFISADVTDVYFPNPRPEGITFLVQSMLDEWPVELKGSFDLVHQRLAIPAAPRTKVQGAIRRYIDLIKPGGWIQFVEADHSVTKGPAMSDFFQLLSDVFAVMNTGPDYAPQLKKWLTDFGLEEVHERIFDVPIGVGNEDSEMKEKSARMMDYGARGLIEVGRTTQMLAKRESSAVPTSFTDEKLAALAERIHDENMSIGGNFRLHCVWGRRPESV
ncbi:hypothetical protein CC78DRAFT_462250 [Lojkania enalia]|uniref:Uncharacterized protein n=1 Tax=Lojkania enalia TaxID=147567 RepID=A0A9P4KCF8_9PLEO|nr:hypothetical protein CC78DRAFT_462250 [Didymosphaeria enalia]